MQGHLEEIGDTWGLASACNKLGQLAEARCEFIQARALFSRALALLEKTGDQRWTAHTLSDLDMFP